MSLAPAPLTKLTTRTTQCQFHTTHASAQQHALVPLQPLAPGDLQSGPYIPCLAILSFTRPQQTTPSNPSNISTCPHDMPPATHNLPSRCRCTATSATSTPDAPPCPGSDPHGCTRTHSRLRVHVRLRGRLGGAPVRHVPRGVLHHGPHRGQARVHLVHLQPCAGGCVAVHGVAQEHRVHHLGVWGGSMTGVWSVEAWSRAVGQGLASPYQDGCWVMQDENGWKRTAQVRVPSCPGVVHACKDGIGPPPLISFPIPLHPDAR